MTDLQQLREAQAKLGEEVRTSWGLRERLAKTACGRKCADP